MEDTVTLTKRFLWRVDVKTCLESFQGRIQREEVEAETINNSSAKFCWKDEKWILLENRGSREGRIFVLFFKDRKY